MDISPILTASSTHSRITRCRSATTSVTTARTAVSHRAPDVCSQLDACRVRSLHQHRLGHLADAPDWTEPERRWIVGNAGDRGSVIRDQGKKKIFLRLKVAVKGSLAQPSVSTDVVNGQIPVSLLCNAAPGTIEELPAALFPSGVEQLWHLERLPLTRPTGSRFPSCL